MMRATACCGWRPKCLPSEKRLVLLRSVIQMARGLDMQVVAEGIETDQDAAALRLLKERFPLMKRA